MLEPPRAPGLVVDASVLVELVVGGTHAASADRLLAHLEGRPQLELVSAAHGLLEAMSALRRLNLRGALGDGAALDAARWLRGLDLRLDPTAARVERVWALRHSMTAYDAAYAAAAEGLGLPLISADRPLIAACQAAEIDALHLAEVSW